MSGENKLAVALEKLRAGAICWSTFIQQTGADWGRHARRLLGRYTHPAAITEEDVQQELLWGAWIALPLWDPSRGVTLHAWVTWNAITRAKRFIHRQRGAVIHGNADKHESRYSIEYSAFMRDDVDVHGSTIDDKMDCYAATRANSEERDDWAGIAELIAEHAKYAGSERDHAAREALIRAGGDPDLAGVMWFNNREQRSRWLLDSEREAAMLVRREISKVRKLVEELTKES